MSDTSIKTRLLSLPYGITVEVPIDWTEEQCEAYALDIMQEIIKNQED